MRDERAEGGGGLQSVEQSFAILEAMAEHGAPIGVSELARRLACPKPRVFRHLRTLVGLGYVEQEAATEKYRLSLRLYRLGQIVADGVELLAEARPLIARLRDDLDMTVSISTVEANGIRVHEILRPRTHFQISTRPGALLALHASAQGKLAMAFGEPDVIERVLAGPLEAWTPKTITDPERLRAEVLRARELSWAVAPEETLIGVNALAAPIFDGNGRLAGTLAIVGSLQFIPAEPPQDLIDPVAACAREISRRLGQEDI
jgi:DNA-binding IclR family transcriptional regulator